MRVDVRTSGDTFGVGATRELMKVTPDMGYFQSSPDETRWLVAQTVGAAAPPAVTVVLNWTAALHRK